MRKRQTIIPAQLVVAACTVATVPQPKTTKAAQAWGGRSFQKRIVGAARMYEM
jgi:hypothetical protein